MGWETAQPKEGSTTTTHVAGFEAGSTEDYPVVELKLSIPRDMAVLEQVMDAIIYDPQSDNPNRWWNNGRGLPDKV